MKELIKTKTVEEKWYMANDGVMFDSKEKCIAHEQTAECKAKDWFNKTCKKKIECFGEILRHFDWDTTLYVVPINNEDDLDNVNAYLEFHGDTQLTAKAIGSIRLIAEGEWIGTEDIGTPEELKKEYCDAIDSFVSELKGEN